MKIHALATGTVQIHTRQVVGEGSGFIRTINMLRDPVWTSPLPILTWVLEHPEGVIVIDTGETAATTDPKNLPQYHPFYRGAVRFNVQPDQELVPQLKQLGIGASDVRKVILTHLHSDHAGGLSQFPKSEIFVHRNEYAATQGIAGFLGGYLPKFFPTWFSPKFIELQNEPFGVFPTSQRVTKAGDVVIVPTHGHTPSHVSVIVVQDTEHIFLAGDTSYTQANLQAGLVDGVSPDIAQAAATNQRILDYARKQPTVYLVTHDPDSAARLENRTILGSVPKDM